MTRFVAPELRQSVLSEVRQLKMARSTHAYVRGSTAQFYRWLAQSDVARSMPNGPPVWICGDCHIGNLGPLADGQGRIAIQIRDLDQTVIGNPAHDVLRLALSLQTAVRSSDLPGVVSARMIEAIAEAYETAFLSDGQSAPEAEPVAVRTVRQLAKRRRWKHLADERIDGTYPTIPLGKKFWPISPAERAALAALLQSTDVRRLALTALQSAGDSTLTIHDAAYWRKGCSSLGLLRYAVLIGVSRGDGRERLGLIDVKEAAQSLAPRDTSRAMARLMPRDNAKRVVAGARALSPFLGDRLAAGRLLGKSVVVRELLPQDLKIEIEQFNRKEAVASARYLAQVVGQAHARQMDEATRSQWHRTLTTAHGRSLDAPLWLWRAVVELVALHEAGYLEHCRAYALKVAA